VLLDQVGKSGLQWVGNCNELNASMVNSLPLYENIPDLEMSQVLLLMAMHASMESQP
jgi:hypothetical protein